MSRPIDYHSRQKHAVTIDALSRMIADLETTITANEPIGTVQRKEAIITLARAREDLSRCTTLDSEMVKYIADFETPNHMAMENWINDLSIDLKLYEYEHPYRKPMTMERMATGKRLVFELTTCRTSDIMYRGW